MANLSLNAARPEQVDVVESIEQMTLPAGEAITPGAPVRIDSTGKFVNAAGGTTTNAAAYGIAVGDRVCPAGFAITAVRQGTLHGVNVSALAFGAAVYISDTAGRLGDTAGTVSVVVGRVVPAWGQLLGQTAHKLLRVNMP